jgi:hypothetical protein
MTSEKTPKHERQHDGDPDVDRAGASQGLSRQGALTGHLPLERQRVSLYPHPPHPLTKVVTIMPIDHVVRGL